METWEHIAPELPPGWSVENSGDMDYQQNWATRAADGTVTERGFCGREYAAEDCWEQFGITRKRYAELIAVEWVREVVRATGKYNNCILEHHDFIAAGSVLHKFRITDVDSYGEVFTVESHEGTTLCEAAWACIQALEGESND